MTAETEGSVSLTAQSADGTTLQSVEVNTPMFIHRNSWRYIEGGDTSHYSTTDFRGRAVRMALKLGGTPIGSRGSNSHKARRQLTKNLSYCDMKRTAKISLFISTNFRRKKIMPKTHPSSVTSSQLQVDLQPADHQQNSCEPQVENKHCK